MTSSFIQYLFFIHVILHCVLDHSHCKTVQSDDIPSSPLQNTINLAIRVGENESMNFILQATKNQTLANTNLPVWTADAYHEENITVTKTKYNVSHSVGDFRTYQDLENNAALVFFNKTRSFYGVLGSKYYIVGLPVHSINEILQVGGKYVKRRPYNHHEHVDHPKPPHNHTGFFPHSIREHDVNPQLNFDYSQTLQNTRNEDYYIEILVFVTWDITQLYYNSDANSYLTKLIMDHIVYFNAIDMMFAKLRLYHVNIRINLSGMIIENAPEVFASVLAYHYLVRTSSGEYFLPRETIRDGFIRYLKEQPESFAIDSYDLIFLTFGRNKFMKKHHKAHGITYPMDMYAMRQAEYPDEAIPMVAMHFKSHYDQYCVAAHEIGHALYIFHPTLAFRERKHKIQCTDTAAEKHGFCLRCADWSSERIEQSRKFLRGNRNRCFLRNYPTSLSDPSGIDTSVITSGYQCHCYGYHSNESTIPRDACGRLLQCNANDDGQLIDTILPLDGTPCGDRGVCWHKNCVDVEDDGGIDYWSTNPSQTT